MSVTIISSCYIAGHLHSFLCIKAIDDGQLKVGAICVLTRNPSVRKGSVRNARIMVKSLQLNYVEVTLLSKNKFMPQEHNYCIPHITFEFQSLNANFTIHWKQYPFWLAYATTFNSCQGLTLKQVVLDLRIDVFAHGQLYTALTWVHSQNVAMILIPEDLRTTTTNIVYRDLLL